VTQLQRKQHELRVLFRARSRTGKKSDMAVLSEMYCDWHKEQGDFCFLFLVEQTVEQEIEVARWSASEALDATSDKFRVPGR